MAFVSMLSKLFPQFYQTESKAQVQRQNGGNAPPQLIHRLWSEYTVYLKTAGVKITWNTLIFRGIVQEKPIPLWDGVATTCKTLLWWKGVFIIVFLFYICFYWQTDSSRTLKTQIFHESKGKKTLPKWICGERELVRTMMGLVTALLACAWAVLLRPGLTERAEWVIVNEQS